jgi:4-carboxymuconolactone decarboxylase
MNSQNDSAPFDVDAREAHVIGNGPRIAAIPDAEIAPRLRALVNQARARIGLGEAQVLHEYTRLIAKSPPIFQAHMEMGTAVFSGEVPPRERELAVLRIGWLCRAPYEWGEHVDIAKRYGVTPEEVERITQGSPAVGWNEHEAAILRGVEELISDHALSDATYATLARRWSEVQLIEYLMTVGHYVATALVQNSLRAPLAHDNPGLRHR